MVLRIVDFCSLPEIEYWDNKKIQMNVGVRLASEE